MSFQALGNTTKDELLTIDASSQEDTIILEVNPVVGNSETGNCIFLKTPCKCYIYHIQ